MGDGSLGRKSARDQSGCSRRLHDVVLAGSDAGHEDPELRRDQVPPFAPILANLRQLAPATDDLDLR